MLNQEKIGKFIAERRKKQSMTQKQLAEKLHISDKAISKWETGKSMPDNAILLELCELLKVNVNELLSGEKLSNDSYHGKAEENMVKLIEQSEKEKKMRRFTGIGMIIGAGFLIIALLCIIWITGGNTIWYVDMMSLFMIAAITFIVLALSGLTTDFFKAFAVCVRRKDAIEKIQINRSLTACRITMTAVLAAGIAVAVIGVISILSSRVEAELAGVNMAVAILPVLYSIVIDLFILPVSGRLNIIALQNV